MCVRPLSFSTARPYADAGQFGTRTPKGDITITTRVQGVTVGASAFFQGTAILHVLSNAIRVLEPGGLYKPLSLSIYGELILFVR